MARKKRSRLTPVQVVKQELGVRPLARQLGISPRAVTIWGELVPSKYHTRIIDIAGGRITAEEIINGRECHG